MKLKLLKRELLGSHAKNVHKDKMLSANLYGKEVESLNLQVNEKEFMKVYRDAGFNKLIDAEVEGQKDEKKLLIREVQIHPISEKIQNISFYQVDMNKAVTTKVPLVITGESQAVKKNLGILVTPIDSISIKCLPKDIPDKIEVGIESLTDVGSIIHSTDLKLPSGVEYTSDITSSLTIAYIAQPQKKVEETVVAVEGAVEGEVAAETTEEKPAEEEAKK